MSQLPADCHKGSGMQQPSLTGPVLYSLLTSLRSPAGFLPAHSPLSRMIPEQERLMMSLLCRAPSRIPHCRKEKVLMGRKGPGISQLSSLLCPEYQTYTSSPELPTLTPTFSLTLIFWSLLISFAFEGVSPLPSPALPGLWYASLFLASGSHGKVPLGQDGGTNQL